jgi:hypothetical protein
MKKLLLFLVLLMTAAAANAITIEDLECNDGFSFTLYPATTYSWFNENNWSVKAVDRDFGNVYSVDGSWKDLNAINWRKGGFVFQSTSLVPAGSYTLNITRLLYDKGQRDAKGNPVLKESESVYLNMTCPPESFRCAKLQMNISDCYTLGDDSYLIIDGVSENIVLDDLWFKLDGTTRHWLNQTPEISALVKNDVHYIFSAYTEGTKLEWAEVGVDRCDNVRYAGSESKVRCSQPRVCTKDDDCKTYEFCNQKKNSFCQPLNCTDGKFHKCSTREQVKVTPVEQQKEEVNVPAQEPVNAAAEKSWWDNFIGFFRNLF